MIQPRKRLRSRRWLVVVGLIIVTAVLFVAKWLSSVKDTVPHTVSYDDATTWGREVANGKHPVFVRKRVVGATPPATDSPADEELISILEGRSLGRLEGSDLTRLLDVCLQQVEHFDSELVAFRETMNPDSPKDHEKEASILQNREQAIVVYEAVGKGNYFVVTQETANMLTIPPNHAKTTMSCTKNGQFAIAVVLMSYDEYPVLAHVYQFRKQAKLWALEELVREFNQESYSARRSKVDRYIEIRAKSKRTDDDQAFVRATFPSGVRIDEHRALLEVIR